MLQSPEYPRWARASALTYDMIFNEPIRHEYRLLKMPVLLVIGQSDRSVFFRRYASPEAIKPLGNWPMLGREALKDLPDGKLVEITDAGRPTRRKARRVRRRPRRVSGSPVTLKLRGQAAWRLRENAGGFRPLSSLPVRVMAR